MGFRRSAALTRARAGHTSVAMELRHLEQIVAIARHGGFGEAARRLGISQPTLSKSIARLESQMSIMLFHRDGGRARPTSYGQFLADRGETLLKEFQDLNREFKRLVHGEKGQLRIGVGPAPMIGLLPGIVAGMTRQFPGLALHTTQDNAVRIVRDLVDGAYDAAFVYYGVATPFEELIRIKVMERPYVAAVRAGHPAAQHDHPLTPRELLRHRIAAGVMIPAFAEWTGPVTGVEAENLKGFSSDSYDLIRTQVLDNDFVSVAPDFIFEADVKAGLMVHAPITWDGIYECWMLTTRERWGSPQLKALAELAKVVGGVAKPAPLRRRAAESVA
jgi:DNA-binding transcriptional LysR family regulator